MHRARAVSLGLPCVRILGAIERHNAFPDEPIQWRGGWAMDANTLWQQAAIGPDAIDVVQTYDDYPVISMLQFEDLGFCAKDAGASSSDATSSPRRQPAAQHRRRTAFRRTGRRGWRLSWPGGGAASAHGSGRWTHSTRRSSCAGQRLRMINYDRGLCTAAAVLAA